MDSVSGNGLPDDDSLVLLHPQNMSRPINVTIMGYFNAVFMLLFLLIGLPWNVMVIGIILKKKLYSQPSLMLMLNLAVANILGLLCNSPLIFLMTIGNLYGDFDYLCITINMFFILPLVSAHTIAMMSVDRVIYLKKPLTYHLIVTPWRMFAAVVTSWISSISLVLPLLCFPREIIFQRVISVDTCAKLFMRELWFSKLQLAMTVVVTLVQFVGCGCIIWITRSHLRRKLRRALNGSITMKSGSQTPMNRTEKTKSAILKGHTKSQQSVVVVFGAIFIAGLLSLIPLVLLVAISAIFSYSPPSYLYVTAYIFYLARSACYPILEVTLTYEIRIALCKLCTTWKPSCCANYPEIPMEPDV